MSYNKKYNEIEFKETSIEKIGKNYIVFDYYRLRIDGLSPLIGGFNGRPDPNIIKIERGIYRKEFEAINRLLTVKEEGK